MADAGFSFYLFFLSLRRRRRERECVRIHFAVARGGDSVFVDKFWLKPKVLLGQGGLEMDYDAPFFLWLVRRVILVYQDGTKKREVLSHSVKGAGGEVERRHNEICDYTHHDKRCV